MGGSGRTVTRTVDGEEQNVYRPLLERPLVVGSGRLCFDGVLETMGSCKVVRVYPRRGVDGHLELERVQFLLDGHC